MMTRETFFHAVAQGDAAAVSEFCTEADHPHEKDQNGRTALMLAAGLGYVGVVKTLLQHGADVNTLDNMMGISALHVAAQRGDVAIAKLLLECGAQINLQAISNGLTPLMNAVWYGNVSMVEFLLAQPDINTSIRATFGVSAKDLVDPGAVVQGGQVSPSTMAQITAELSRLFAAYEAKQTQYDDANPLLLLVQQYANNQDEKIFQAIQQTLMQSQVHVVNAKTTMESMGNAAHTALLMAARDGLADVVRLLLDVGADMALTGAYMHATPLHKAAYMGHADVIEVLATQPEQFAKIANMQGPYNGYTALHDAVWHNHVSASEMLLRHGADPALKGLDGCTALDLAKKYGYDSLTAVLECY